MRIDAFILCEDIRRELGSKFSVMGILGDGIEYHDTDADNWPKPMNFAAYIKVILENKDSIPDRFTINVLLEGEKIASVDGAIAKRDGIKTINLPISMPGLPLTSPGKLVVEFTALLENKVLINDSRSLEISARVTK